MVFGKCGRYAMMSWLMMRESAGVVFGYLQQARLPACCRWQVRRVHWSRLSACNFAEKFFTKVLCGVSEAISFEMFWPAQCNMSWKCFWLELLVTLEQPLAGSPFFAKPCIAKFASFAKEVRSELYLSMLTKRWCEMTFYFITFIYIYWIFIF